MTTSHPFLGLAAGIALALAGCGAESPTQAPAADQEAQAPLRGVEVALKPHAGAERIEYIDVRMTLESPQVAAGEPFLGATLDLFGMRAPQYDLASLKVRDDQGELALEQHEVEADLARGSTVQRTWSPQRATQGDVVVEYRAPVGGEAYVGRPMFDLRAEGMAVNGAGMLFAVVPLAEDERRLRVRWDLAALPPDSLGVWAFGESDATHVGPPQLLSGTFYGAGRMQHHSAGPFGMYWASPAPFDIQAIARDTERTFDLFSDFFRWTPESYRVFVRRQEKHQAGGTALSHSFIAGYMESGFDPDDFASLLAHEMAHTFLGSPKGSSMEIQWYAEGGAEYYHNVVRMRAGLIDSARFLEGIHATVNSYYRLPSRHVTVPEAAQAGFFTGTDVQRLGYGRGRLYLAAVNAKIVERTGGARSLDDITLQVNARARQGDPMEVDEWLSLVEAEIGPEARSDHEAFLHSRLYVPPSNIFGPCFERVRDDFPGFELGFDRQSLQQKPGRVQGLVAGSAAARAGLREGDAILSSTPLGNDFYSDVEATITIEVERDGERHSIEYLPRGETIESYDWIRVAGVPEEACKV